MSPLPSSASQRRGDAPDAGDAGDARDAVWSGTYRLQLHRNFTLDAARAILPYLKRLHISHVYLSPCLQAVPGSTHGYDVTDPTRVNPEIGGEAAWTRFVAAARELGLQLLLDIVPNHLALSPHNRWWNDVLAHGPFSEFAGYFDLRLAADAPFRIELCSLSRPYGDALRAGELTIGVTDGALQVRCGAQRWPLSPASWSLLFDGAGRQPQARAACFTELRALQATRHPSAADCARWRSLRTDAETILARALTAASPTAEAWMSDPGLIDLVLGQQFYTLHHWTLAPELTNYRRFFEVGTLIGVRTEIPAVLQATHARVRTMIERGDLHHLRIDHPDGLRDPERYFEALRQWLPDGRIYLEKILDDDERLPPRWPVDGTVGYDFLARVNRLWMDHRSVVALTAIYADFTGQSVDITALGRQKRRAILETSFFADLERLVSQLADLARGHPSTRDLSVRQLREILVRITVTLPRYRTYRTRKFVAPEDARVLTETIRAVQITVPGIPAAVFEFVRELWTRSSLDASAADLVLQWQQLTPAVMAKGVEDTMFYCFDRLLSCNEVGAAPSLLGISAEEFHEYCHDLAVRWPRSLLSTSTHDSKRSEDVRTRLSVLSELPDRWAEALHRWAALNAAAWNNHAPDRHAEYHLYQTLIGAWPLSRERCSAYMLKACREAKLHTSWREPDAGYEAKIQAFVDGIYGNPEFLASLRDFTAAIVAPGRINSLAQTLIKMVAPGVPDFYQGCESWELSLVDPDNRRPVDYDARRRMLDVAERASATDVMCAIDSGLPKLWMIRRVLELRSARPELFGVRSDYQPLVARGAYLGSLLAFRRGAHLITVVPRLAAALDNDWSDTLLPLPGGTWVDHFTGERFRREVTPDALFAGFPVALLVRESIPTGPPQS